MAKPQFCNVDLEIVSASKLDLIVTEMGKRVTVMHLGPTPKQGGYFLALECSRHYKSPDAAIHALCSIVEALSPESRQIWKAARKVFDIGYELSPSERSLNFTLRTDTLRRIAALEATVAVTCYRGESNDDSPKSASKR